jgi:DNA polymerase (family 10)
VTIVINPDAHSTGGLDDMEYGVGVARRGWLGPRDVFNSQPLKAVAAALEGRRERSGD